MMVHTHWMMSAAIAVVITMACPGCGDDEPTDAPASAEQTDTTADGEAGVVLPPRPVAIERDTDAADPDPDPADRTPPDAAATSGDAETVSATSTGGDIAAAGGAATPLEAVLGFIDACRTAEVDRIRSLTIADTPRRRAGLDYLIAYNEAHRNAKAFVSQLRLYHGRDADPQLIQQASLSHPMHVTTDDPSDAQVTIEDDHASVRTKKYTYNVARVDGRWFVDLDILGMVVTQGGQAVPDTRLLAVHTVFYNAGLLENRPDPETVAKIMRLRAMLAASMADRYLQPPRVGKRTPGDARLKPPLDLFVDLDIAITTGDEAALARLIDRSTPQAQTGYQVFVKQIRAEAAYDAFTKAVAEKFTPVGLARLSPHRPVANPIAVIARYRDAAKARIDGDRATVTFSSQTAHLVRRDGRWRVDLSTYPLPLDYVGSVERFARELEIFRSLARVGLVENAASIDALASTRRLIRMGLYTGLNKTHPITDADRAAQQAREKAAAEEAEKAKKGSASAPRPPGPDTSGPVEAPTPPTDDGDGDGATITTEEGSTITPD